MAQALTREDLPGAVAQTRSAVRWLQTWRLETWGERDNSQGRLGTRFARIAGAHGQTSLVRELDAAIDLDDRNVLHRMAAAPAWVQERHDRSWRARTHVDECVTRLQDARDTPRVCSLYALRQAPSPPYPAWLAISPDPTLHAERAKILSQLSTSDWPSRPIADS